MGEGEGCRIDDEVVEVDGPGEGHSGESAAPRKGDIDLTVRKRRAVEVDVYLVESEALGFVDGDGPGEFEWELGE